MGQGNACPRCRRKYTPWKMIDALHPLKGRPWRCSCKTILRQAEIRPDRLDAALIFYLVFIFIFIPIVLLCASIVKFRVLSPFELSWPYQVIKWTLAFGAVAVLNVRWAGRFRIEAVPEDDVEALLMLGEK